MSSGKKRIRKRQKIWERDGGRCFYCGTYVAYKSKDFTLDHIIPRSKGGPSKIWNLTTCCVSCNLAKDDLDPSDKYLEVSARRKALSQAYISLGQAFESAKEMGDFDNAEYLFVLQQTTRKVLYGNALNQIHQVRAESLSPKFMAMCVEIDKTLLLATKVSMEVCTEQNQMLKVVVSLLLPIVPSLQDCV